MTPTRQQITDAKQYVLDRVEAELSSVSALDTRLLRAARDIIRIARKYNVPPERFRFSADTRLQREGRVFVLSPSRFMDIGRMESDLEKLGEWYWLGYRDTMERMNELRAYLDRRKSAAPQETTAQD